MPAKGEKHTYNPSDVAVSMPPYVRELTTSFVQQCLDSAELAIARFTSVPPKLRDKYVTNQVAYWRNVAAGYRWQLSLLKSRRIKD